VNPQLAADIARLESLGRTLQPHIQPDGWVFLIAPAYPLGPHFTPTSADVLVKVPPMYPFAGLDMFWTEPHIRLATGAMPASTCIESYLGREWLRFSWHPTAWRQGVDNLGTFFAFIDRRLANGG
jgi:Prokaryotic E2 family E